MYRTAQSSHKALMQPDDFVSPTHKESVEYGLQWAQYMYDIAMGDPAQKNFEILSAELTSYAEGRQDPKKYMDLLLDDQSPNNAPRIPVLNEQNQEVGEIGGVREGFMAVNFKDVFSPMPKYMMIINGIIDAQEHDVTPEAVDPFSTSWRQDMKFMARVRSELKEWEDGVRELMGMPDDESVVLPPQELDMWSTLGIFKLPYEVGLERVIEDSIGNSQWSKMKSMWIPDLVKYNKCASMVQTDPVTFEFVPSYLDPVETYQEGIHKNDFADSRFAFTIVYKTVGNILEEYDIPQVEIQRLVHQYDHNSPMEWKEDTLRQYLGFRVPVLIGYYRSVNTEYRTTKRRENGLVKSIIEPWESNEKPPKEKSTDKKVTTPTKLEAIYEVHWPINWDKVLLSRRMHDTPFDYSTRRTVLPIMMVSIPGKSMVENATKVLDMINLTMLRLENSIAKSPPKGIAIDIDKLENIRYGKNMMEPIDIIRLYKQSGDYIYRVSTPAIPGGGQMMRPIEELTGGLGSGITDAIQSMEFHLRNLAEVTGLDRISSVSKTPGSEQGATVTELAVQATGNNLKPLYKAYLNMKENIVKHITLKAQAMVTSGSVGAERLKDIMGIPPFQAMVAASNRTPQQWGYVIKSHPTQEMKANVAQASMAALAGGKNGVPAITHSEYLFIIQQLNSVDGINTARAYLEYKEKKREQMDAERNQQMVQAQTQASEQASQTAIEVEKMRRETEMLMLTEKERLALDRELAVIEAKKNAELEVLRANAGNVAVKGNT